MSYFPHGDPAPGFKTCVRCGKTKDLTDFHRTTRTKCGRIARCKTCKNKTGRVYRSGEAYALKSDEQWEVKRRYDLFNCYGITLEEYNELLERQGGVCALCWLPETKRNRSGRLDSLHVDHDHITGKVRGLLCGTCNRGIGLLKEDPTVLLRAVAYLKGRS